MGKAKVNRGNNFIARANGTTWQYIQALKSVTKFSTDESVLAFMATITAQHVSKQLAAIESEAALATANLEGENNVGEHSSADTHQG
jgi:hypothetical protein